VLPFALCVAYFYLEASMLAEMLAEKEEEEREAFEKENRAAEKKQRAEEKAQEKERTKNRREEKKQHRQAQKEAEDLERKRKIAEKEALRAERPLKKRSIVSQSAVVPSNSSPHHSEMLMKESENEDITIAQLPILQFQDVSVEDQGATLAMTEADLDDMLVSLTSM
jgi:hypothetical protein